MRRAAAPLTALLLFAAAANAQPVSGSNVVVVQVTSVVLPATLPGPCLVRGVVAEVREGKRFATGQALKIDVPCSDGKPHLDDRPAVKSPVPAPMPLDPVSLRETTRAVAHLNDAGQLDWTPSRGGGQVAGFRILKGGAIAVSPALTPL